VIENTFRTMIVPAPLASLARALGAGLSSGGAGMFTTGLSANGAEPATHYVSTGLIGERFAECIASADTLHAACTEAGASVTRAQCDALVAQSDVSEDEPFAAFARLGLVLVQKG
jgi:hypothetical protein